MMTITDLINAVNYEMQVAPPPEPEKIETKFYAHIDTKNLVLVAISPNESSVKTHYNLEIDSELALRFLKGEENPINWVAGIKDDKYEIARMADITEFFHNRIDTMSIRELSKIAHEDYSDINVLLDEKNDTAEIHYNGERIQAWPTTARLYFTKEGNPSYLKCAFSLDINIINKITEQNGLSEWPNPILLKVPNMSDLSVYSTKSNIRINLKDKHHEEVNN